MEIETSRQYRPIHQSHVDMQLFADDIFIAILENDLQRLDHHFKQIAENL